MCDQVFVSAERMNTIRAAVPIRAGLSGRVNVVTVGMFYLAAIVNAFSYMSLAPILVAAIFFLSIYSLLIVSPLGGLPERRMFCRVFSVGFFMAGIAAIYANQFQDAGQLFSDPAGFFNMATSDARGLSMIQIQVAHEGALGIVLWRSVYDFFAALGFEKARYIGTTVNITAVSLTGVIGIKVIRQLFGNDDYRFRRLTLLVSACGLFWLFAGIHLRDSVVLLAVSVLFYAWLTFMMRPDIGLRLGLIIGWSFLGLLFLGFLRGEFVFVPVAMAFAAIIALYLGRIEPRRRFVVYGLMVLGAFAAMTLYQAYGAELQNVINLRQAGYTDLANAQQSSDSLGMTLIVNQPMPIRLILGSAYLFVFPIPFWSGFQLESAYNLFKSVNVIYLYFVSPLLLIAVIQLMQDKKERTPALLFILFLAAGFTVSIAATSLETRHFGAFLMPILVLSTVPDLREFHVWRQYKIFFILFASGVIVVHALWLILKLL